MANTFTRVMAAPAGVQNTLAWLSSTSKVVGAPMFDGNFWVLTLPRSETLLLYAGSSA